MINALSVDVEDYYHVSAFENVIDRADWDHYPSRVADNTRRVLDLFDMHEVTGTFFVLGWVAEREPQLVRDIVDRGHELACHGYWHQLIYVIGPERFREDVICAKKLLEDVSGKAVNGYRAPSYSITAESLWALDILVEAGFTYDSSIFPIHHDRYGIPGSQRFPHIIDRPMGGISEFPITTYPLQALGRRLDLPVSGGGYFRLLPYGLVDRALRHVNEREGQPAVVYFHPWEIDPGQPRIKGCGLKSRFRHYVNLDSTYGKLERLLSGHEFAPLGTVLQSRTGNAAAESA
ncbi:XrtA system polysaccharide deacetylase [Salidesulfovibrio brasiliensis]